MLQIIYEDEIYSNRRRQRVVILLNEHAVCQEDILKSNPAHASPHGAQILTQTPHFRTTAAQM